MRTPAALCGVIGLKPAAGHLSTDGVVPLSETCDHVGLLTADVHSAAVAWDVLARPDGTGGGIQLPGVSGVRVGVPVGPYWTAADPVIGAAVERALDRLRAAGAEVVEVATPGIEELAATYTTIVGAEAYATHAAWLAQRPGDYQAATRTRLEQNADLPARAYVDALRARRRLSAALGAALDVDVLVLATTQLRATPLLAESVMVGGVEMAVRPALLALTLPFNLTGWAAVSVPGAVDAGELPTGVQVVGVRIEERGVLRVAAAATGP